MSSALLSDFPFTGIEDEFDEQEFISTVNSSGFKHLQSLTIHDDIKLGTNPKKPVLITYIFQRT